MCPGMPCHQRTSRLLGGALQELALLRQLEYLPDRGTPYSIVSHQTKNLKCVSDVGCAQLGIKLVPTLFKIARSEPDALTLGSSKRVFQHQVARKIMGPGE